MWRRTRRACTCCRKYILKHCLPSYKKGTGMQRSCTTFRRQHVGSSKREKIVECYHGSTALPMLVLPSLRRVLAKRSLESVRKLLPSSSAPNLVPKHDRDFRRLQKLLHFYKIHLLDSNMLGHAVGSCVYRDVCSQNVYSTKSTTITGRREEPSKLSGIHCFIWMFPWAHILLRNHSALA